MKLVIYLELYQDARSAKQNLLTDVLAAQLPTVSIFFSKVVHFLYNLYQCTPFIMQLNAGSN